MTTLDQATYYCSAKHLERCKGLGYSLFSREFNGETRQYTLIVSHNEGTAADCLARYKQQWGDVIEVGTGKL